MDSIYTDEAMLLFQTGLRDILSRAPLSLQEEFSKNGGQIAFTGPSFIVSGSVHQKLKDELADEYNSLLNALKVKGKIIDNT